MLEFIWVFADQAFNNGKKYYYRPGITSKGFIFADIAKGTTALIHSLIN